MSKAKQFGVTLAMLALTTTMASAGPKNITAKIEHVYVAVWNSVPTTAQSCYMQQVPIYEERQVRRNPAEGALLGMLLGGVTGKVVTGNDKGAAGGAIIGGLIGADKGGRSRTTSVVIGYDEETVCNNITTYHDVKSQMYSHSTIKWKSNGKNYKVTFEK